MKPKVAFHIQKPYLKGDFRLSIRESLKVVFHKWAFLMIFLCATLNGQPNAIRIGNNNIDSLAQKFNIDDIKLKQEYFRYVYLINKNIVLKKYRKKTSIIPSKAVLAYEMGDIEYLLKEEINMLFFQLEHEIEICTFDIAITENRIKTLLETDADIIPETDSLERYVSFSLLEFQQWQKNAIPDSLIGQFLENEILYLMLEKSICNIKFQQETKLPYALKNEMNIKLLTEYEDFDLLQNFKTDLDILNQKLRYLDLLNEHNQLAIKVEGHYKNIMTH